MKRIKGALVHWLQVLGLCLDLIGVALLGLDLIRIQRSLQKAAAARISRLEEIADENDGVGDWVKEIAKSAYWTEYHNTEGSRYEPSPGTFDPEAARRSFEEAMEAVRLNSNRLDALGEIIVAAYQADKVSAASSLLFSYFGLALIVLGFALQIVAAI